MFRKSRKRANGPSSNTSTPPSATSTSLVKSGGIASGAAKGLLYSLIETLGTLVGDPDLPEHARSGYEGLLETARELRTKLDH